MFINLDTSKIGATSDYLKKHVKKGAKIDVVSPRFTIYAFNELREILENCERFRFLFNEPTFVRKEIDDKRAVKEFVLKMSLRERDVSEFNLEIGLKNNLDQNQVAQKCYDFIQNKGVIRSLVKEGRYNTRGFTVKNPDNTFCILGGSVSFTKSGLGYTDEENAFYDLVTVTDEVSNLNNFIGQFEKLYCDDKITTDVKNELLKYLTNIYKENAPELIYYYTLYKIFGEKLLSMDDMARVKEKSGITKTKIWQSLYNFQHDAVVGAIKKLQLYNGCIIADSVGLGKTFEALAIIKYFQLFNSRILVLCPKKLRNNWVGFKQNSVTNMFADDKFDYDVINHTDLSRSKGYSGDIDLAKLNWGNYHLVVIDESHNFRNNDAFRGHITRYQKLMNEIIKNGIDTKVLLLTATPVNNSLTDLKNQIMLITKGNDNAFEENAGIHSIEKTLTIAQRTFNSWSGENKQDDGEKTRQSLMELLDYDFFSLLNTATIARSRKHIKTFYDTRDIGEFPVRNTPVSIKADIDTEGQFPELSCINDLILRLNLAVYCPMLYLLISKIPEYEEKYDQAVRGGRTVFKQADRERAIVSLVRTNLLKRMESSVYSFSLTVQRIIDRIHDMVKAINQNSEYDEDINFDDEDFDESDTVGGKIKVKICDIDRRKIIPDLEDDEKILQKLLKYAKSITPERDNKLKLLMERIENKIKNPSNSNNRKVIVFTTFTDTAEYIFKNVSEKFLNDYGIYSAYVSGTSVKNNMNGLSNDFDTILTYFSPRANHFDTQGKELDLLIATDCISEGQNLQDCDYLINYDIHWNPVRIVQRFGRIDRIGSTNKTIQMVNFWPNLELDEYIRLEQRVRNKMIMLDVSATGDENLLDQEELKGIEYRKKQLLQLQNEVLDVEDVNNVISITDLTLDDFIMSLDRYMKEHPDILEKYPSGVYAVTSNEEKLGDTSVPGVVFCLKQTKYSETLEGAVSLYPYYLVYVKENGDIHVTNSNPKKILDIFKALCQGKTEPIEALVKRFNKETKNGSDMRKYTNLLEKAVFDIKGVIRKQGIQSLFQMGPADLNSNKVKGINDFELVSFLVIK